MVDYYLITGIAGLATLLIAFFLGEFMNIGSGTVTYNVLNIIGSILLGVYAWSLASIPFVILEIVWAIVAAYKLVGIIRK